MAYQHMVIKTKESKVEEKLDKWGPQGFRVVGIYRRGIGRVTIVLERDL